jgi:preprotein translocase SecF subunit
MRIFEHINIDFLGKRKFFYILSATLFIAGMLNIAFRGLQFGIDFKGGSEIVLQFDKPVEIANIRNYAVKMGLGEIEIKTFGQSTGVLIRTNLQEIPGEIYPKVVAEINKSIEATVPGIQAKIIDSTVNSITYRLPNPDTTSMIVDKLFALGFQSGKLSEEVTNTAMIVKIGISDWVQMNLKKDMPNNHFKVIKEDKVGPKVGNELKLQAIGAVFLSLLCILVYLGFRYKFIFAISAVIALFHDVLITLGLYSILYGLIPGLNLDINLTVMAAFFTLMGYSMNDTVIVYDRVRENLKIFKTKPLEEVVNMSVNRTMSRTILTGGTTIMSVGVLLIFGGEVLRSFAFTLFFGIIIGTYSSIFVASAIVVDYAKKFAKKMEF